MTIPLTHRTHLVRPTLTLSYTAHFITTGVQNIICVWALEKLVVFLPFLLFTQW